MSKERIIIESLFRIADKDGGDVDFMLNPVQAELDANLTGRDLVPKARQEGVSSYVLARFTAACMMRRNVRAVVISHESEATQRMLMKVKYFLTNIRGPQASVSHMNANEIIFPKMGSMFYIGTAGAKAFGRGDTITHLHCSEYAYWENPKKLMSGLLQAVPASGEIIIESTGNGMNDYARRCLRAYSGASRWKAHFFPWHTFPEYTVKLSPEDQVALLASLDEQLDEPKLSGLLSPGQILWRRQKLEELEYDIAVFHREYPMSIDECFEASSASIFQKINYKQDNKWKKSKTDPHAFLLEGHPHESFTYSLGADPAGGIGKDASVIEVICLDTNEQVAEYSNNKIAPDHFGAKISEWGHWFNDAYVTVESNNHGILALAVLVGMYPDHLIYKKSARGEEAQLAAAGYRTTQRNKPLMIGTLRKMVAKILTIYSPLLKNEMGTFIENENGELGAEEGCFDDTVMAMACAAMGHSKAALYATPDLEDGAPSSGYTREQLANPFLLDNIIEELRNRGIGYPIKRQDGWQQ